MRCRGACSPAAQDPFYTHARHCSSVLVGIDVPPAAAARAGSGGVDLTSVWTEFAEGLRVWGEPGSHRDVRHVLWRAAELPAYLVEGIAAQMPLMRPPLRAPAAGALDAGAAVGGGGPAAGSAAAEVEDDAGGGEEGVRMHKRAHSSPVAPVAKVPTLE